MPNGVPVASAVPCARGGLITAHISDDGAAACTSRRGAVAPCTAREQCRARGSLITAHISDVGVDGAARRVHSVGAVVANAEVEGAAGGALAAGEAGFAEAGALDCDCRVFEEVVGALAAGARDGEGVGFDDGGGGDVDGALGCAASFELEEVFAIVGEGGGSALVESSLGSCARSAGFAFHGVVRLRHQFGTCSRAGAGLVSARWSGLGFRVLERWCRLRARRLAVTARSG